MGRVVLVTGVSRDFGGRFARRIAAAPGIERVIGVDTVPPRGDLGPVSFVRADIRNPVIAKVITGQDVDTVVHLSVQSAPHEAGGRTSMKEHNVIGTMQLLAACQRAPGLERLVVKSSSEVYGSSSKDPAMFTEEMAAKRLLRSGYAKDVLEVEGYVRGFSRRRPDVIVTLLRNANTLSSQGSTPLGDYLRLNPVPRVVGFDARIQVLHYDDLVGSLHHACLAGVHG
ncbi:MAG: NAD-dependent epimerase/dehydratase family protein, partial [Nocardioidaceae bacterium]